MEKVESWEVSDAFWERVAPHIPKKERRANWAYSRAVGAGRPPLPARQIFEAIVYVRRTGIQ